MIKFPRHVSIVCPPAHKAITIFKFGHLHVLVIDDGVLRRASAALRGIFPVTSFRSDTSRFDSLAHFHYAIPDLSAVETAWQF